jgi:two-component system response regulator YesN
LFAIQNIAQDLLHSSTNVFSIDGDRSHVIWFIQPKAGEALPDRTFFFAEGIMGQAQEKCKSLLRLDVSFVISERSVPFSEIDVQYHRLKNLMFKHSGLQNQLFLIDRLQTGAPSDEAVSFKKIAQLKIALERNEKNEFSRLVMELAEVSPNNGAEASWDQAQLYFELVSLAIVTIQQLGMKEEIEARFDLSALLKGVNSATWQRFLDEYRELMAFIFESRSIEWERQGMDIVLQIKEFIAENLHADLSLSRIAEHVSYHPAYLSRLYKQLSGKNLSDDIAEMRLRRVEQLLLDKQLKIHEVGNRAGFDSPRYFTKFFKSHTGLTPQEYRERNGK